MTEKEYQSLVDRLGSEERVRRGIEILNAYKGAHGKRYKSDYLAFLNWVVDRLEEKERKNGAYEPLGISSLKDLMEKTKAEEKAAERLPPEESTKQWQSPGIDLTGLAKEHKIGKS